MNWLKKILNFFNKHELTFYFVFILLIVFTFSFSRYILRAWEIMLVVLLFIGGNYDLKWRRLKKNRALLVMSSFFFMYVIAILYTPNWADGTKHLRAFLPWLGLPVVIAAYPAFSKRKMLIVLKVFVLGVVLHTLLSLLAYWGVFWEVETFRDLGLFYPSHRFALTIVLGIFFMSHIIISEWQNLSPSSKWIYLTALVWLTGFLLFTRNLTGILIFIMTTLGYGVYLLFSTRNRIVHFTSITFFLIVLLFFAFQIYRIHQLFWTVPEPEEMVLDKTTARGNPYFHDTTAIELENGHYIDLYVCKKELKKQWSKMSNIPYSGKADNGGEISEVLKKYLTSKGLRKDSVGMSNLSKEDIRAIEEGTINYKFRNYDLTDRLYNLGRELYLSKQVGKPTGTLTKRLFAIKNGLLIWKEKPWLGHGVRTLKRVYENYYEERHLSGNNYFVTAHNQYVRYLIEFGVLGLAWFLFSIFYPYFAISGYRKFLFNCMFAYFLIASIMNNTFSSQLAITIWVTFYSVFFVYINAGYQGSLDEISANKNKSAI